MLRRLFSLRGLIMVLVALGFAWATYSLGQWQYGRHEAKVADRTAVETNYDAAAVPLATALDDPTAELAVVDEWTAVELQGEYLPDEQMYVRNRPFRGTYGYEVVVPFHDNLSGHTLLIDRGWVQNAETADVLPEVPDAPSGEVSLTGWLRIPEIDLERDLPAEQLASINVSMASEKTGLDLVPSYVELASETTADGQTPPRPEAADRPDTGTGPHLAYAIQWWLVVPLGFVLILVLFRREQLDERDAANPAAAKPRKQRIWDDEDE